MHALRLPALIRHYTRAASMSRASTCSACRRTGCPDARRLTCPVDRIAAALGARLPRSCATDGCPGLAFVHDARTLTCAAQRDRPAAAAGEADSVRAAVHPRRQDEAEVRAAGGDERARRRRPERPGSEPPVSTWTRRAATRTGRRRSMRSRRRCAPRGLQRGFVACGDSNAFAWRRQPEALQRLLAPLAALRARADSEGRRPTHYFARQNEGKFVHGTGVLLGKLGLDIPLRYDVVCSNLTGRRPRSGRDPGLRPRSGLGAHRFRV